MDADAIIDQMLTSAWDCLRAELKVVNIEAINESVFRYFCIRALADISGVRYETEWRNRVDLHVMTGASELAVEFKFYASRSHQCGVRQDRRKGGASKQNEAEFAASWRKLDQLCSERSDRQSAYVVLVYQAADDERTHRTFHKSYGSLDEASLPDGCAARAIHRLAPIEWKLGHRMHCVLFRLR